MKKKIVFFVLSIMPFIIVSAQDWDLDTIFDEPVSGEDMPVSNQDKTEESSDENAKSEGGILSGLLRKRGFALDAFFYAYGGVTPGWSEAPWYWGSYEEEFSHVIGMIMAGYLSLDFQISDSLRVKNTFGYGFPSLAFSISEFFLDYNIKNFIFFRAGKYTHNWGISTNYPFTNLLSRVPSGSGGGESYIFKFNIPIGIGGLEFLALTRDGFMENKYQPSIQEVGFGGKYNLAFQWADIDIGFFYYDKMPLRGMMTFKTTVDNIELYAEGMTSINHGSWNDLKFSASWGFLQDILDQKFTINGEIFYNGELDAYQYIPETDLIEAEISPFITGFNGALNLIYRPRPGGGLKNLRFFNQVLYSFKENSAYITPGFSLDPFPHVSLYMAAPVAAGSRDGTYYRKNADKKNRPFSIVFLITINGGYSFFR